MDQDHPMVVWLKAKNMTAMAASKAISRSQSCVSRWVRGDRHPSPAEAEAIAKLTNNAVPATVWHEWAVKRAREAVAAQPEQVVRAA